MSGFDDFKRHWIFHLNLDHPYLVAGGFFRDNLLGVPPKDIDVYIGVSGFFQMTGKLRSKIAEIKEYNLGENTAGLKEAPSAIKMQGLEGLGTKSIFKIRTWMGEQLDTIVLAEDPKPHDILKSFDFTVNQIGWFWDTSNGELIFSNVAIGDIWARRLRVYKEPISDDRREYMEQKGFRKV